jgi:uncharacterized membrane protein YgcG
MRRALPAAVLGAVAVALLVAAPAHAAQTPAVRITAPAGGAKVDTAVVHTAGTVTMANGNVVRTITLTLESLEGHGSTTAEITANDQRQQDFAWDSPAQAHNGQYRLRVRAWGREVPVDTNGDEANEQSVVFGVAAPPAAPTWRDPAVTVDKERVAHLTWNPNPEPDVLGYQVQRSLGSGPWEPLANVTTPSWDDPGTADAGGTYRYQLVAVRAGATPGSGVSSAFSEARSVKVPNPPPTTTTTAGSGSGSSNGSGSGGSGSGGGAGSGSGAATGSGSSDTGTGGTTTGRGTAAGPVLPASGTVDLSAFSAQLDQARKAAQQGGVAAPGTRARGEAEEPDTGFDQNLPFKARGDDAVVDGGGSAGLGMGGEVGAHKPIGFVAASLLVTVVLMHLLWLKREVDREPLVALLPGTEEPA